jgi:hypothetical protein
VFVSQWSWQGSEMKVFSILLSTVLFNYSYLSGLWEDLHGLLCTIFHDKDQACFAGFENEKVLCPITLHLMLNKEVVLRFFTTQKGPYQIRSLLSRGSFNLKLLCDSRSGLLCDQESTRKRVALVRGLG